MYVAPAGRGRGLARRDARAPRGHRRGVRRRRHRPRDRDRPARGDGALRVVRLRRRSPSSATTASTRRRAATASAWFSRPPDIAGSPRTLDGCFSTGSPGRNHAARHPRAWPRCCSPPPSCSRRQAHANAQIEDYAEYQPQTKCAPKAKPGTKALARWLVQRGGGFGPISRACKTVRHLGAQGGPRVRLDPGRRRKADRRLARQFLGRVRDRQGGQRARQGPPDGDHVRHLERPHVLRLGPLRAESLPQLELQAPKNCSATLRHRNHMHISLSRAGGRGATSWYDGRVR